MVDKSKRQPRTTGNIGHTTQSNRKQNLNTEN